jgi:hypothetical protein
MTPGMVGEVALVGKADRARDVAHGEVGFREQLPGPLYPAPDHVLVRRETGRTLELPGEVVLAQVGNPRHLGEPEVHGEIVVHEVRHTPERASGKTAPFIRYGLRGGAVPAQQVRGERGGQGITVDPAARSTGFHLREHREAYVLYRVVALIQSGAKLDCVGIQPIFLGHVAEESRREAHHEQVHVFVEVPANRLSGGLQRDVAFRGGSLVDPVSRPPHRAYGLPQVQGGRVLGYGRKVVLGRLVPEPLRDHAVPTQRPAGEDRRVGIAFHPRPHLGGAFRVCSNRVYLGAFIITC